MTKKDKQKIKFTWALYGKNIYSDGLFKIGKFTSRGQAYKTMDQMNLVKCFALGYSHFIVCSNRKMSSATKKLINGVIKTK